MAGHGSPPPEDKANHPGRQVGSGWKVSTSIGTQPKPLGPPSKLRPEPLMVQRVRRQRIQHLER
jgi:hypothetical protein